MTPRTCSRLRLGLVAVPALAALVGACSNQQSQAGFTQVSSAADPATSVGSGAARSTTTGGASSSTGGTSATDAGTAAVDPCELVTEADATAAFGEPAEAGTQSSDECWWQSANELKTINIIRRSDDLDEWRRGYQNDSWSPIDLGDEGYAGKLLDSITFRVGDTIYEINVVYSTKGDPQQVVQALATKATSRL